MSRSPLALALALATFAATLAPAAASASSPAAVGAQRAVADATPSPEPQAKNAGSIGGLVASVDYGASTMTVTAGSRHLQIHVLPSTNIQGPGNAFHTIADIKKGAHVRVLMSQVGSTYNAQLITLK
ncbi:MAG: hypothetical protein GIX03_05685 [Candidatus Eremiobacteraeota bacterium]|nr:hypothetical protein [Candidatus Eremiobacteraeota bacterium]MBC5802489.1 hypothetical protein [Candidatus Eremiobacteraeota bacterium]MBC5821591.1 hypothetical protein [Candidatus Eremiobacteraeota bacterium]